MATTADGSVLYFSISMRQKGSDQPLHGKVFRVDAQPRYLRRGAVYNLALLISNMLFRECDQLGSNRQTHSPPQYRRRSGLS